MDANEFRLHGKEMIDYIADYMENIKERRVTPDVEPGYLSELLPREAPQEGERWQAIFDDFEAQIMPGVSDLLSLVTPTLAHPFLSTRSPTGSTPGSTPTSRPATATRPSWAS